MTLTIIKRQLYRYEGGLIYVDATNSHQQRLQSFGCYEPAKVAFFKRWWQPYHTFVDVGASCGYFTLLAARYLSTGSVHAIEPEPTHVEYLGKAISMNSYHHVRLYPVAIADYNGEGDLYVADEDGQHSLHKVKTHMRKSTVMVRRLDDVLRERRVDAMKIDVEGVEMAVLKGADTTLRGSDRMAIAIDLHPEYQSDNPHIGQLLQDYGFRLYDPRSDMQMLDLIPYNCHEIIAVKG